MCTTKELSSGLTNENKSPTKLQIQSARDTIVILSDAKDLWYFFLLPDAIIRDVSLRST